MNTVDPLPKWLGRSAWALLLLGVGPSGCVTMAQHKELQAEVHRLNQRVSERDKELQATLQEAESQLEKLKANAEKVEKVLRTSQAGMGVRVENLEMTLAELRGSADDARMEADSSKRSIEELRGDLDNRLNALEGKLNSATDIPESRTELLKAAKKAFDARDFARARRLYRTFVSRYPEDKSGPEVRYQIGLTLYEENDFRAAAGEFNWIRKNAAKSAVIHDAVYYIGMSFAKQGECGNAVKYFEYLASRRSGAPRQYRDQAKKQIDFLRGSGSSMCKETGKATDKKL